MDYIEYRCKVSEPNEANEIFIAWMAQFGFDSFSENEEGFSAFILSHLYNNSTELEVKNHPFQNYKLEFEVIEVPTQNWNETWESSYPYVLVDDKCLVRAPFHEPIQGVEFDIIVEPKMSFGTAHHETTFGIIQLMLEMDFKDEVVMDMGCGTGVLGILAMLKEAKYCVAIDNDEWAYLNSLENFERNKIGNFEVIHGDAKSIPNLKFDTFIANINRNILVRDMEYYVEHLKDNGRIIFSGFYDGEDFEIIKAHAAKFNLKLAQYKLNNQWVAATFIY